MFFKHLVKAFGPPEFFNFFPKTGGFFFRGFLKKAPKLFFFQKNALIKRKKISFFSLFSSLFSLFFPLVFWVFGRRKIFRLFGKFFLFETKF